MAHGKVKFTIPNKLYGDKAAEGYGSSGLVVHKLGRGWTISHAPSGMQIRGGSIWTLKTEALERMDQLLALRVRWDLSWDEMANGFSENREAIKSIVMAL